MSIAIARDGTEIYYEAEGDGPPVVLLHEFGGDLRSLDLLSAELRGYRRIRYNARGFPPSGVPDDPSRYSQALATGDLATVMDAAGLSCAHIVGSSMGAVTALDFALRHEARCLSLSLMGYGYGTSQDELAAFRLGTERNIALIEQEGMVAFAKAYADRDSRLPFKARDPAGHARLTERIAARPAIGAILTLRQIQLERTPIDGPARQALQRFTKPLLIVTGDRDGGSLQPSVDLRKLVRDSALAVLPRAGHTLHLESHTELARLLSAFIDEAQRAPSHHEMHSIEQ